MIMFAYPDQPCVLNATNRCFHTVFVHSAVPTRAKP
jgi:hypothetical protein